MSRQRWGQRYRRRAQQLQVARDDLKLAQATIRELQAQNEALRAQLATAQQLAQQNADKACVELPPDPPAPGQQFGPRLIELSINLARRIGMRRGVRALKLFFQWLQLEPRLPGKDAIRGWMQRLGVARMQQTGQLTDAIWLADETVQIGREKVLAIVAVEAHQFLQNNRPLAQEDLHVLAFQPATSWTAPQVTEIYQELVQCHGPPRAVITDGAKNLREGIKTAKTGRKSPLALRDLKHLLANALQAEVADSPAFQAYTTRIHQTISAVQQTELAHLAPPSFNRKARFMNLRKHLRWFGMILWQWEHPESDARQTISPQRLREKFGWVAECKSAVQQWQACQRVISACLKFCNAQGVYRGAATELRAVAQSLATCASSKTILRKALDYLRKCERKLGPGERLPLSTEILESSFGSYKRLEGHHSRGGFTTLLPVFSTLLKATTAQEIVHAFQQVKVKDVRTWLAANVPSTVTARKQAAYREARPPKSATLSKSTN